MSEVLARNRLQSSGLELISLEVVSLDAAPEDAHQGPRISESTLKGSKSDAPLQRGPQWLIPACLITFAALMLLCLVALLSFGPHHVKRKDAISSHTNEIIDLYKISSTGRWKEFDSALLQAMRAGNIWAAFDICTVTRLSTGDTFPMDDVAMALKVIEESHLDERLGIQASLFEYGSKAVPKNPEKAKLFNAKLHESSALFNQSVLLYKELFSGDAELKDRGLARAHTLLDLPGYHLATQALARFYDWGSTRQPEKAYRYAVMNLRRPENFRADSASIAFKTVVFESVAVPSEDEKELIMTSLIKRFLASRDPEPAFFYLYNILMGPWEEYRCKTQHDFVRAHALAEAIIANLAQGSAEMREDMGPKVRLILKLFEDRLTSKGLTESRRLTATMGTSIELFTSQISAPMDLIKLDYTPSGTGVAVSDHHVLTSAHVLPSGIGTLVAFKIPDGALMHATCVLYDRASDLAVLETIDTIPYHLEITDREPRLGEDIMVMGYPLTGSLGQGVKLSPGKVTATEGFGGKSANFQISAIALPGNSGGPVISTDGRVIGLVEAILIRDGREIHGITYCLKMADAVRQMDACMIELQKSGFNLPVFGDNFHERWSKSVGMILVPKIDNYGSEGHKGEAQK